MSLFREKRKQEKGYDSEEEDEDQNDGPVAGNPFKAVNVADLEKKVGVHGLEIHV